MPLEAEVPEWVPEPSLLDGRIVVPGVLGAFLVAAAPLLWLGATGRVDGYLVLYWGGIVALLVGAVCAFVVGLFTLGTISLGGIAWVGIERFALAVGPPIVWGAPVVVVVGVLLLPAPLLKARKVAAARLDWRRTKGGSVAP
ncbi:MAG: hypothetical protein L3K16_04515 [Thermoplasmata archaeon]|nr:hypothetical protein [Thermoplasmata archaeon]